jgi:hypothetical protein
MSSHPLDLIDVQKSCPASWNAMVGDRKSRFCAHCQKHVHDLSAMSRDEAETLVCQSAGDLCIRLTRAADGQLVTLDYQKPDRGRSWRFWTLLTLPLALISSLVGAAIFGNESPAGGTVVAGTMVYRPPAGPIAPTGSCIPSGTSSTPQADADFEI